MSAARFIPVVKSRVATATAPRFMAIRSISSTANYQKGPIDATKDTLKKADEVVSNAAVKGIDKGEQARNKMKEAMGTTGAEAKAKAEEMKGDAAQYAGQGKGQAAQAAGEAKGKAQEAMGEMKGKAKEAKREHLG